MKQLLTGIKQTLSNLMHSRKFMTLTLDFFVSTTLYFASKYLDPGIAEDIKTVILGLQVPVASLIASIAYEDGKRIDNGI